MSKQLSVGNIAFGINVGANGQPVPGSVRVVKAADRPTEKLRRHGIGLLRELVTMYPNETREIMRELSLK